MTMTAEQSRQNKQNENDNDDGNEENEPSMSADISYTGNRAQWLSPKRNAYSMDWGKARVCRKTSKRNNNYWNEHYFWYSTFFIFYLSHYKHSPPPLPSSFSCSHRLLLSCVLINKIDAHFHCDAFCSYSKNKWLWMHSRCIQHTCVLYTLAWPNCFFCLFELCR